MTSEIIPPLNDSEVESALFDIGEWFAKEFIVNQNLKAKKLKDDLGPVNILTLKYLAHAAFGDVSDRSLAKAIVYPKLLGTSVSTSFGTGMPMILSRTFGTVKRISPSANDIIYYDFDDHIEKVAKLKLGPKNLNDGDVKPLREKFESYVKSNPTMKCVVGVIYGEDVDLNGSLKTFTDDYSVYTAKDFWRRLTGRYNFYERLVDQLETSTSEASSIFGTDVIEQAITDIESIVGNIR